jgi:hypothetical protein
VKRLSLLLLACTLLLAACGRSATPAIQQPTEVFTAIALPTETPQWTVTPAASPTATAVPATATPEPSATPAYPPEGRGPTNFAADIDPLTGLPASSADLLNRRPIVIKVENIPRAHRPQWGLSLADVVWEYYTEFGATRFAAVFYGNDAQQVGPIRSGRFFDVSLVSMYKGIFVYGSAYEAVRNRFYNSDFSDRLIIETLNSCPAVCRFDPNGQNLLVADTAALMTYAKQRNIVNTRQNLDGMFFQLEPPTGGKPASTVFVRYSGAIYNRWDYDTATGRYLRFSDTQDDVNRVQEGYAQLTDRLTSQPIAADNVVTMCVPHKYYVKNATEEVLEILLDSNYPSYYGCDGKQYTGGTGAAYVSRDGQIYPVTWKHESSTSLVRFYNADGTPFALKPGQTWFEVIGASSKVTDQGDGSWRFTHIMVP